MRPPRRLRRIDIYTDGACPGNGRGPRDMMGAGIVARPEGFRGQREWSIPLGPGTNQKAELLAIREALLRVEDRATAHVRIFTDSAYAIGCLMQGWKVKVNKELVDALRPLIAECGRFEMVKVPAHAGDPANVRADRLAVEAARRSEERGAESDERPHSGGIE